MTSSHDHPVSRRKRGVLLLPSALTLGNLFLGTWAIVAALRGQLELASWLVLAAGAADWLDGRVARLGEAQTRFGAELDSLADMVSFGVAPATLAYYLFFSVGEWSWVVCFLFVSATALRLARFNVEQKGRAKLHFLGLPSPAAGGTIAAYYPFSLTDVFQAYLASWPWSRIMAVATVGLAALMLTHIPYAAIRPGVHRWRARGFFVLVLVAAGLLVWRPSLVAFPLFAGYVVFGLAQALWLQLLERFPGREVLERELEGPARRLRGRGESVRESRGGTDGESS